MVRTFQHLRLWAKMSVLENVLVGCRTPAGRERPHAVPAPGRVRAEEAAARERALQVLEFFGLAARAHELAEDLAYPEQKLLSMARMLRDRGRRPAAGRAHLGAGHRIAGEDRADGAAAGRARQDRAADRAQHGADRAALRRGGVPAPGQRDRARARRRRSRATRR